MLAAWLLLMLPAFSQNIAINTDASLPNANAILDIKSDNKGLLIPRMSTKARNAIPNTRGLLVYDINTDNFWYNTGSGWQCLLNDNDRDNHGQKGMAWLLTGNNNTKDGINFLGTTNNIPLNIRVNNQPSGRIDSAKGTTHWGYKAGAVDSGFGNTAIGSFALRNNSSGNENTANGYQALYSNTTGYDNTANGYQSLANNSEAGANTAFGAKTLSSNTTGVGNTATGDLALYFNTSGTGNTANGYATLTYNRTGMENIAVGDGALTYNTEGSYNVASGFQALMNNRTGSNNVAVGNSAMYYNISGSSNTAGGSFCMFSLDSGYNNTAYGSDCLGANHTGSNNTALGASANVSADNLNNATAIGYGAIVNASNKVRIGNAAVTVIEGQVPFTTPSDGRFKFNIQEDVSGLDFILHLRPVTYQFDTKRFDAQLNHQSNTSSSPANYAIQTAYDESSRIRRSGFIAQEVEKAANASGYNFSGIIRPKTDQDHYSLSYDAFVVPLVKAVQEQQQQIADLRREVEELKKLIQHAQ